MTSNCVSIVVQVWKVVMKIKDASDYITCAEVWIEYANALTHTVCTYT